MSTMWKSQVGEGGYRIQFETDDYEKYKVVENACCAMIALEKLKHSVQKLPKMREEKND